MNQYETGKHVPDFASLKRIADVLGLLGAYFYTEDNALAELIALYTKSSNDQKNLLRTFILKLSST